MALDPKVREEVISASAESQHGFAQERTQERKSEKVTEKPQEFSMDNKKTSSLDCTGTKLSSPPSLREQRIVQDGSDGFVSQPVDATSNALKAVEGQMKQLDLSLYALKQHISEHGNVDLSPVLSQLASTYSSVNQALAKINSMRTVVEQTFTQLKVLSGDVSHFLAKNGQTQENGTGKNSELLQSLLEKVERNDRQLAQVLRENANFQIQVRQGMQQELDRLKKQLSGENHVPLLKELSTIYVEYQFLLADDSASDSLRKNIEALFEQLEDVLREYGAEVCVSEVGQLRRLKTSKISKKIPTGDKTRHNTVAASKEPGVTLGNYVLYSEKVDVYVYDPALDRFEPTVRGTAPVIEKAPAAPNSEEGPNALKTEEASTGPNAKEPNDASKEEEAPTAPNEEKAPLAPETEETPAAPNAGEPTDKLGEEEAHIIPNSEKALVMSKAENVFSVDHKQVMDFDATEGAATQPES